MTTEPPPMTQQLASFLQAITAWASAGFKMATPQQVQQRIEVCQSCEHWKPDGAFGMGRCMKCGCTSMKLALATSACPIGRWGAVHDAS